jgi:hypothetical protein
VTTGARPTLDEIKTWPATCTVTQAAAALGISKSSAYESIARGDFPVPVVSVRRRHQVITAALVRLLSADAKTAGPEPGRLRTA